VDGETWRHYGEALEENLQNLSHRLKRGAYRAKPVRRVYIPKADGRQRPLGVTALEDKLVQRATVEVLNASTKPTSSASLMGSGQDAASIKRWMPCSVDFMSDV
jgi:retron-type reverse transcriptase